MPEYLERRGSEIVNVQVSRRLKVPLAMLQMAVMLDDEPYQMHLLGGGLVAASSYVPDLVSVPRDIMVGPDTHVLTDVGMAGQFYIHGNLRNPNVVSQEIDEDGRKLREEQRMLGIVGRLIEIERRQITTDTADAGDRLF